VYEKESAGGSIGYFWELKEMGDTHQIKKSRQCVTHGMPSEEKKKNVEDETQEEDRVIAIWWPGAHSAG